MKTRSSLTVSLLAALIFLAGCSSKPKLLLPVYGEKKAENGDTVYHHIGNFSFTNQFGEKISNETVKNKIYVADFFFATCQSICPVMSTNLKDVQKAFLDDDSLLILSHSVNPMHDTVQVLNDYGLTYGAKKGKWHLLTGSKKEIYDLAKNSYLVNAIQDDGSPEGFLHSELFILVDKQGRIRGMYDGTDKASISKLIEDIKLLKKEK
jgi:protein SCO1/2